MSRYATDFEMELRWDGEDILFVGKIEPGYPATGPTYDCGGTPGEGPSVTDYTFTNEAGEEIEDPDGRILDALEDKILEAYQDQIADDKYDAAEDRAEARRDAGFEL